MTVDQASIPVALRSFDSWCIWKSDKIPLSPTTYQRLSTTDPAFWADFDTAMSEYVCSTDADVKGIGFCLTGTGVVGIDLDHALDSGRPKPWAKQLLSLLPASAYVEVSPSGEGLHVLLRGKKPGDSCRRSVERNGNALGEVEMYDTARYLTVTGQVLKSYGSEIIEGQEIIDRLYAKLWPATPTSVAAPGIEAEPEPIEAIILGGSQAGKFLNLTASNLESATAPYGGDHSRAIHALTSIVAWYTSSWAEMDSILKASPLYIGKWAPNPQAVGRSRAGKWEALGRKAFASLRAKFEAEGNYYSVEAGRSSPTEDFASSKAKAPAATYQDYIDMLLAQGEVRLDIISNSLYIRRPGERDFEPVFTRAFLGQLRGECRSKSGYSAACVEDYLFKHQASLQPQLLIDIPTWDGVDRIGMMASKVQCEVVSSAIWEDLLKDWCAKLWAKLHCPVVQNRCLLLSGRQGVGKDVWIRSMFGALGPYAKDLVTQGSHTNESDISVVMGSAALLIVSEFDKIRSLGPGVLKDLITKPSFTQVRKYDRDATTSLNRCSVIAACNPEQILDDSTGNRRFMVFRLEGEPGRAIRWSYPVEDRDFSALILGQCRALHEAGYQSKLDSEAVMRTIQAEHTPEPVEQLILEDFIQMVEDRAGREIMADGHGLYPLADLDAEMATLAKTHSLPRRTVLSVLKGAGCQYRTSRRRWYGTPAAVIAGAELLKAKREGPEFDD